MNHHDLELAAVCTFLNELSLDEIIQCGVCPTTRLESSRSDESSCSDDELVCGLSVTGTTSSEGSDSEDVHEQNGTTKCARKRSKRLRTETQRELQRSYDRKFRTNKRARRIAGCEAFIRALQELTVLMHFRIARTENEITRLCLAKKKKETILPPESKARHQLEQNQGVIACIESCTSSWRQKKSGELGKYFLRDQAKTIQEIVDKLIDLNDHLNGKSDELRWRVEGKTKGVWV
ncbi:hypothetical protein PsorP6_012072 [Peronosclerospora sorghi]|uniref:Uncharacterized protein n=1 Tax=Peronosclerospora sorghi TaxID=230839 RepID=A0ACC0WKS2_9STRA|nr:hypothetical protein PsorP6_012072 [Peronosclerospora sorghi]